MTKLANRLNTVLRQLLCRQCAKLDIERLLADRRQIGLIWGVDDVQEMRPDLTHAQAWRVLWVCWELHNSSVGVSWEVLDGLADFLFPLTDEAE